MLDDDESNVTLLQRLLRSAGYEDVTGFVDPVQALAELLRRPADLLLLDLHMPRLDGFAVLTRLAEQIGGPVPLPVMVLTADVADGAKHRALELGACDFLTKPYDLLEVCLRVRGALETRYLHRRLHEHNLLLEDTDARRLDDLRAIAADLAHELRTPLYSIQGITEVMRMEGGHSASATRDLGVIDEVVIGTLKIVNRQIGAALLASAPAPTVLTPVTVAALLARVERMMHPLATAKGLQLVLEQSPSIPDMLTDEVMVAQVLSNLIANAIHHTASGSVSVHVTSVGPGVQIAFEVRDTGVGIDPVDHEQIFEPRARLGGLDTAEPGGLGLPLARRLARLLGGDVSVSSSLGQGSSFTASFAANCALR